MAATRQKREVRRRRHQSAWIAVDGERHNHECLVHDVSLGGAKIIVDAATDVGTHFTLSLVPNQTKCRRCEVVWRRGRTLGIRFID